MNIILKNTFASIDSGKHHLFANI